MSSEKESAEQMSFEGWVLSRGDEVPNSHFSKINANNGKSGWLKENGELELHFYMITTTIGL